MVAAAPFPSFLCIISSALGAPVIIINWEQSKHKEEVQTKQTESFHFGSLSIIMSCFVCCFFASFLSYAIYISSSELQHPKQNTISFGMYVANSSFHFVSQHPSSYHLFFFVCCFASFLSCYAFHHLIRSPQIGSRLVHLWSCDISRSRKRRFKLNKQKERGENNSSPNIYTAEHKSTPRQHTQGEATQAGGPNNHTE